MENLLYLVADQTNSKENSNFLDCREKKTKLSFLELPTRNSDEETTQVEGISSPRIHMGSNRRKTLPS